MPQVIKPVVAVALHKCISDNDLRKAKDDIKNGTTAGFSFTAEISGRLERGKATSADASCSLLSDPVLAMVIHRLGVKREAFERELLKVAVEAHVKGVPLKDQVIEADPELLTIIHGVKKNIVSQLPRVKKAGAIDVMAEVHIAGCKIR